MPNPFTYCELHTSNPGAAKTFYGKLLDWKLKDMQAGDVPYTEIQTGEGLPAGLMGDGPMAASYWLAYIRVPSLDTSVRRAQELGGSVLMGRTEIAGMGWFALLADPTGARFGLYEPMKEK